MSEINNELLTTLQPEDIEVAGVMQSHLAAMADEKGMVRLLCKDCGEAQVIDDKLLGTEITCTLCDKPFQADWGEPVAELPQPTEEERVLVEESADAEDPK